MNPIMQVNGNSLPIKEIQGQRVVTIKQVAQLHNTTEECIRQNFKRNREYFIEGQDYSRVKEQISSRDNSLRERLYFTESGYLMLVKSLTDKTAWAVQRALVQTYFKVSMLEQMISFLPETTKRIISYRAMGLTQKETGKLLDMCKDTVRKIEGDLVKLGYVVPVVRRKADGYASATLPQDRNPTLQCELELAL